MTKKDYVKLADALRTVFMYNQQKYGKDHPDLPIKAEAMHEIMTALMTAFEEDNPNFNKQRFIEYTLRS